MIVRLTDNWSIDLDADYQRDIIDGQMRLMVPGRTIWLQVWTRRPEEPVADTMAWIKTGVNPDPVQRFDEADAQTGELRYASWYPEPNELSGGVQWSLYGYTVRPISYVQSVFISDSHLDLEWALARWRSLSYAAGAP